MLAGNSGYQITDCDLLGTAIIIHTGTVRFKLYFQLHFSSIFRLKIDLFEQGDKFLDRYDSGLSYIHSARYNYGFQPPKKKDEL